MEFRFNLITLHFIAGGNPDLSNVHLDQHKRSSPFARILVPLDLGFTRAFERIRARATSIRETYVRIKENREAKRSGWKSSDEIKAIKDLHDKLTDPTAFASGDGDSPRTNATASDSEQVRPLDYVDEDENVRLGIVRRTSDSSKRFETVKVDVHVDDVNDEELPSETGDDANRY